MAEWNPVRDWSLTVKLLRSAPAPPGSAEGLRSAVVEVLFTASGPSPNSGGHVVTDWFKGEEIIDVERRAALIMWANYEHMTRMLGEFAAQKD